MIPSTLIADLNYTFNDTGLLKVALTHRSACKNNNERLEFLGDAVLGFLIADKLYTDKPNATEGELTRLRACLVNKDALAEIAQEYRLGEYLHLGGGELKSGGYRRESILADAMEAIIGAIYLDGGINPCRDLILRIYKSRLKNLPSLDQLKDPKTRLQELLQAKKLAIPVYQVIAVEGPPHKQEITVECDVLDLDIKVKASGESKRKAEQATADLVLKIITEKSSND